MSRTRVAVIGGGRNPEHEVSLASAASVVDELDSARYAVTHFTIDRDGTWQEATRGAIGFGRAVETLRSCDIAFPLVHGRHGEDGTLAALCELIGMPYVGSGVAAGAMAMDKHITKLIAHAAGIATTPGVLLDRSADVSGVSLPAIVKPVGAGSSVGVSLVTDGAGMSAALDTARSVDDRVLVEEFVTGREIDIAVVRRADGSTLVSPALEIEADGLFDHSAKYDGDAVFRVPAGLDSTERAAIESAAVRVYDALGCSGVARVDFFLTANGLVLNEVNTTPGFTAQSQVPRMFAAAGIAYSELLDLLISDALALGGSSIRSGRGR